MKDSWHSVSNILHLCSISFQKASVGNRLPDLENQGGSLGLMVTRRGRTWARDN